MPLLIWLFDPDASRTHVTMDRQTERVRVCRKRPTRREECREFALADVVRARVAEYTQDKGTLRGPVLFLRSGEELSIGLATEPNFAADDFMRLVNNWFQVDRPDFLAFD